MNYTLLKSFKAHAYLIKSCWVLSIFLSCKQNTQEASLSTKKAINDLHEGKELFRSTCSNCHSFNIKMIGPALADFYQKKDSIIIPNTVEHLEIKLDSSELVQLSKYIKAEVKPHY